MRHQIQPAKPTALATKPKSFKQAKLAELKPLVEMPPLLAQLFWG